MKDWVLLALENFQTDNTSKGSKTQVDEPVVSRDSEGSLRVRWRVVGVLQLIAGDPSEHNCTHPDLTESNDKK